jgi:ketosteroid isomerase-like protein
VGSEAKLRRVQTHVAPGPEDIVRRSFEAFRARNVADLLDLLDPELEFRPVTALGLTAPTGHGHRAIEMWMDGIARSGAEPLAVPRTIELVGDELVLAAGVLSERGRMAGRFAASVAWVFRVRHGRIVSAFGYPSEAAARRAIREGRW